LENIAMPSANFIEIESDPNKDPVFGVIGIQSANAD